MPNASFDSPIRRLTVIEREHVAIRRDRGGPIIEHLVVERGDPVQQHEPDVRVLGQLCTPRDDFDELVDLADVREQAIECRERDEVVRSRFVDLAPAADRLDEVAALALVNLGNARPQARREILIGRGGRTLLER